jgi:hypothetical protein
MAEVWGIPRRKAEKLQAETAKTEGARKGKSSANLNTNPRNENCIITKSDELTDFYFDYYKDIRSYNYEEE